MIILSTGTVIRSSGDPMFSPKTDKVRIIAENHPSLVEKLDGLFSSSARIYIDYANVRPWSEKLRWHIDLKRLKQFLDSFSAVQAVNFYGGYLEGDERSEKQIQDIEDWKYVVRTKPVKIMQFSIIAASVPADSTALLEQFIRRSLLRMYDIRTVEYLNERFRDMNKMGVEAIEDRKCNFDVEIGIDMLMDYEKNGTETFVLWSGDSDFADPVEKLLKAGKKVVLFATAGKIARELNALKEMGLLIFDVYDLKEFICWNKEMP